MPNQQDAGPSEERLDHAVNNGGDTGADVTWPGTAAALATWPDGETTASTGTASRGIPLPEERLDPHARTIWLINNLIATGIVTIIAAMIMYGLHRWRHTDLILVIGIPIILLIVQVIASWIDVTVRYRQWQFEIRADEVDLKHGFITHTRQLVPMARIQHVDTRQGPIERHYGLSSVIFYTAAGSMEIPALSVARAGEVRNQIAALAKVHDDL